MLGFVLLGNYQIGLQVLSVLTLLPGVIYNYTVPHDASGNSNKKLKIIGVLFSIFLVIPAIILSPTVIPIVLPEFTESFVDYAHPNGWSTAKDYIARYRLEKKDPAAEVSEVVKPIIYYLSKEIPEKWRPAMKKGIEDWAPAFEKAGFKNAIICKDAPTKAEDPNFDPEDARYSVIRWVAEPIANAMGPHVHDPRKNIC